jgi:hypothetical protein
VSVAERAVRLIDNLKPDYHLILSISDHKVTFGDIVAHAVLVSSLSHILSHFQVLCDSQMRPLLTTAIDGWDLEKSGSAASPILADYDEAYAGVSKLFDQRHAICHEAPGLQDLSLDDLESNRMEAVLDEVRSMDVYQRHRIRSAQKAVDRTNQIEAAQEQ